jgi:flavin-dependent dehydrogenase
MPPGSPDVLIAGAGPAGAIAALVLARAGVRVRVFDRARFPRHKLCGDSLNPGALALLDRLGLGGDVRALGVPITGMIVSGDGVVVDAPYPDGVSGLAIRRDRLDLALIEAAVRAGATFDDGVAVTRALVQTPRGRAESRISGIATIRGGIAEEHLAPVTIAADGRRSALAFSLGLAAHPATPRRWAVGAYMSGIDATPLRGEMHIRPGHYIGVAPTLEGGTNVCVVRPAPAGHARTAFRDPAMLLQAALQEDPLLRQRCDTPRCLDRPTVLGPLAVDATPHRPPPEGLLLAGDAAGFVDPMTGDGMRFAMRGGELAALAALRALATGWTGVQAQLAEARRQEFTGKWRMNRTLRSLVGSPVGVRGATFGARVAPSVLRALVTYASDCRLATRG